MRAREQSEPVGFLVSSPYNLCYEKKAGKIKDTNYTIIKGVKNYRNKQMTYEFTNFKIVKFKIGSVFVLTGGNALHGSEMQTHLSRLKKMKGLSKYQLPCKKLIVFRHLF